MAAIALSLEKKQCVTFLKAPQIWSFTDTSATCTIVGKPKRHDPQVE
jgi:hypothetical protein